MIKKLRLKFVLVFLVLVVSVFITSSCYAVPSSAVTYESSFTLDDVRNSSAYTSYTNSYETITNYRNAVWKFVIYKTDDSTQEKIYCFNASNDLGVTIPDTAVFKPKSGDNVHLFLHNEDGSVITGIHYFIITYDNTTGTFSTTASNGSATTFNGSSNLTNCTTFKYSTLSEFKLSAYGLTFEPITQQVIVNHEFQADTSAKVTFDYSSYGTDYVLKYSLSGIEINADLTAPVILKNPVVYSPGVTNLVVSPNTKVYWVLYDSNGDSVDTDIYQVPEYDAVIENSDKKIEYEVVYSEDYTSATLTADLVNGAFSDKLVYSEFNAISSTTGTLDYGYQAFTGSLTLYKNGSIYLYALDSFGNILAVEVVKITDVFNFKESDFSYSLEDNSTLHGGYKLIITPRVKNWSSKVNIIYSIELTSGDELAYVSIDTEFPELSYVNEFVGSSIFTGRITSGDSIIINAPSNQWENLQGSITFKIYKKSDNSLLFNKSYNFNIESFSTGNIAGGSAGDFTGSLPSGSDNSGDFGFNDYGDVTWTDVNDYIGVNGSFWQAVKSILNCFPKWITSPIFFLISAIVAIAIVKAVLPG